MKKKLTEYNLDDQIGLTYAKKYILLKESSDEELILYGLGKHIEDIRNAKCGYIHIYKVSDNSGITEYGWTGLFGTGLSCVINLGSSWYHTSLVKDIDWELNLFHTENSTYKFNFEEYSSKELLDYLNEKDNSIRS